MALPVPPTSPAPSAVIPVPNESNATPISKPQVPKLPPAASSAIHDMVATKAEDDEEDKETVEEAQVGDEDPREHLNVLLIGHVDAGKSTLSGNMVDTRTMQQHQSDVKARNCESWVLAYIMDTGREERAKGMTVEVGRAHFETENRRFTLLDAPGHKDYVPNMIHGATQADVGILVVSARKDEFEAGFGCGGQTREHALLARTLGIDQLLVIVNKMDQARWSQERYDECCNKLRPLLRSYGFAVKRNVAFIPVAALTGDNTKTRVAKPKAPWYDGDTLIEHMDKMHVAGRNPDAPLRVSILVRYYDRGTMALGKVESGVLKTGAKLTLQPTRTTAMVNQVYINDLPVRTAKPGENVTIRLDCGLDSVQRGFVLSEFTDNTALLPVVTFTAQIALVDTLAHRPLLSAGYRCILHIHTIAQECTIVRLLRLIDPKASKPVKKHAKFIKQGEAVVCRIEVDQRVFIDTFEKMPQLGRFTLRDEGKTIAIGKVLKLENDEE